MASHTFTFANRKLVHIGYSDYWSTIRRYDLQRMIVNRELEDS